MNRKRNLNTWFLLRLRGLGMLCKKPAPAPKRIRIASTVFPDGNIRAIDAERHVWVETKKSGRMSCQFNSATMSCVCGVTTVDEFAKSCNK